MRSNVDEQLYLTWVNMRQRVNNQNNPDHKYYRHVWVDPLWEEWEEFEAWAYGAGYEPGLTIDRINNDYGYYAENCRWVSRSVQSQNTRRIYAHNKSGQRGIFWAEDREKWRVSIRAGNIRYNLGGYSTIEEAVSVYNTFILENNLNHPLNFIEETE